MKAWNGLLREYREYLPITDKTPLITMQYKLYLLQVPKQYFLSNI